jgi:hypothetical protein
MLILLQLTENGMEYYSKPRQMMRSALDEMKHAK